ncbi:MAG: MarR family winged helix-turn-helix transcriptional regulator [Burkholderiaceae bacterium]
MNEPTCTPGELAAARKVLALIDLFRATDPDMNMGEAVSFLVVAASDGISLSGLKTKGQFGKSSATRHAQSLGAKGGRGKRQPMGLISSRENRLEARRKVLELTPKGELLAQQVRHVMGL